MVAFETVIEALVVGIGMVLAALLQAALAG